MTKAKKPKYRDPNVVGLRASFGPVYAEMGRSRQTCTCPWCDASFEVYIWSLHGGGKRCPGCAAMVTGYGNAYHFEGYNGRGGNHA